MTSPRAARLRRRRRRSCGGHRGRRCCWWSCLTPCWPYCRWPATRRRTRATRCLVDDRCDKLVGGRQHARAVRDRASSRLPDDDQRLHHDAVRGRHGRGRGQPTAGSDDRCLRHVVSLCRVRPSRDLFIFPSSDNGADWIPSNIAPRSRVCMHVCTCRTFMFAQTLQSRLSRRRHGNVSVCPGEHDSFL